MNPATGSTAEPPRTWEPSDGTPATPFGTPAICRVIPESSSCLPSPLPCRHHLGHRARGPGRRRHRSCTQLLEVGREGCRCGRRRRGIRRDVGRRLAGDNHARECARRRLLRAAGARWILCRQMAAGPTLRCTCRRRRRKNLVRGRCGDRPGVRHVDARRFRHLVLEHRDQSQGAARHAGVRRLRSRPAGLLLNGASRDAAQDFGEARQGAAIRRHRRRRGVDRRAARQAGDLVRRRRRCVG